MVHALGQHIRNEFPIFSHNIKNVEGKNLPLVYLDSAATAQKPQCVINAMIEFLSCNYGTVHRGAYNLSTNASIKYENTRIAIAKLIGKNVLPSEVVFTKGTTESLNIIANGIAEKYLTSESRIVITTSEHHANLVPWQQAAIKKDCEIAYIPMCGNSNRNLSLDLEAAAKLITNNTKVVSVSHVGNVLGQINPIKQLAELAKNAGAFFIVDASQSIASFEDDLFELGADAVTLSLHKMYGPTGVGALVARKNLLDAIPPLLFGGGMISNVTLEESFWTDSPQKFEAGTPDIVGVITAETAINWLINVGRNNIHKHASSLATLFRNKLQLIPNIEVFSPCTDNESVISFRHKRIHAHDLATILDSRNVAMRAGHHCAWPLIRFLGVDALLRASFAAYSDTDDVDAAIDAINWATKML